MKARKKVPALTVPALPEQSSKPGSWWIHGFVLIGLLLANVALYHGTFGLGFLSVDDPDYVQNNPHIDNLHAENLKFTLSKPYAANYAPVNLLSYALDVAIAKGKSAAAVHISNVLWHGCVVCAVYFLAFTIFPSIRTAAAAAALFLLHPAHVEVVAWISSRKDLVATGFAAISMACYLRHRRKQNGEQRTEPPNSKPPHPDKPQAPNTHQSLQGNPQERIHPKPAITLPLRFERGEGRGEGSRCVFYPTVPARKWAWYSASIVSFLLASGGKQSVLLLPAVMLVWDVLVEKRRSWRMFADKVPFGLIVVFFGWMTWQAQPPTRTPHNPFVMAATELTNLWLLCGFGKYVLYRNAPDPKVWSALIRAAIMVVALLVWVLPFCFRFLRRRSGEFDTGPKPNSKTTAQSKGAAVGSSVSASPPYSLLPSPIFAALCYWVLIQLLPPLVISFVIPITDRYLFLPSVGVCILLAGLLSGARLSKPVWVGWALLALTCVVWGAKTWNYVNEWRDPRSVWYGAHLKTKNSQVFQFLGEVYHNAGDRINEFIKTGAALDVTNEVALARAVLGDPARVEQLESEWRKAAPSRTNSISYRDELWRLAWEQYEVSVARRGTLSAPNLFMNRGRLLVGEAKYERAIPEFKAALAFAETSSYDVVRQESVVHAMRGIGVAYWSLRNYREARDWFLKAQAVQRKSGHAWIGTLDDEVRRVTALAETQR
jgi:hypothetical protein